MAEPVDERLLDYCETTTESRAVEGVLQHGSIRAAARALGLNIGSIRVPLKRVKVRASTKGWNFGDARTPTAPDGFRRGRTTTLIKGGENDDFALKWYRDDPDRTSLEQVARAFIEAVTEDIPHEPLVELRTQHHLPELANLFIVTDYHLGMLAWGEETRGGDWDVQIAEERLVRWFQAAIELAPPAELAIAGFLGDGMHYDGFAAVTPASGHNLDSDTRFQKIIRIWIRVRRRIIRMLLEKYPRVHLIEAEGNHSPAADAVNREWWAALYENEPRIVVDTSPDPYYCFEWGLTSLFFHHGHRRKFESVDKVFVAKFRDVFGRTKFSYAHMGHLHHKHLKETELLIVEQHRTLAEADAYASSHGYLSGREAQCITYHQRFGEVSRLVLTPEMLESS